MKVLVVEDEPLIRLGMALLVEEAGFVALEAMNADDAIAKLEKNPDVRLVVTDVDMPGSMDGLKLAHYVSKRWPPIRLLVVSGKVGVRQEELPVGARFLSKPYQDPQLIGIVRTLVASAGNGA